MKKIIPFLITVILGGATMVNAQMADFSLSSKDIAEGEVIDMQHVFTGCGGENISPALSWEGAPEGTKSYAVTVYDPDAPTGSGWWHWVAFNIPANVTALPQGASGSAMPEGAVEGRTDYGSYGYGGPCPPEGHGDHRYIFTVHALDTERLDLAPDTPAAQVGFHLYAHRLGKALLTAKYGR